MAEVLFIDYEKCVGCRTCEMACSLKHGDEINPFRSRIKVVKWESEGQGIPIACAQCESAPCQSVCPVKAISRDEELNRVVIDYDRCIGCRMCVVFCPFGAMSLDIPTKKVIKCDLCDGDPLCVRFCAYEALQYTAAPEESLIKQRAAAEKILGVMSGLVPISK
jgi:carbon-monoxide dehydrogenase iron sulfur subunit